MSVAARLADSVKQVVDGLGITAPGTTTPIPVVVRKRLQVVDGDAPPLILIAVSDKPEDREPAYAGAWFVRYPVGVAVVRGAAGKTRPDPAFLDAREAVWVALADFLGPGGLRAKGLAEVNDVTPRLAPAFDPSALTAAQLDWAGVDATVETLEERYVR